VVSTIHGVYTKLRDALWGSVWTAFLQLNTAKGWPLNWNELSLAYSNAFVCHSLEPISYHECLKSTLSLSLSLSLVSDHKLAATICASWFTFCRGPSTTTTKNSSLDSKILMG
jgi:hypothetical protein